MVETSGYPLKITLMLVFLSTLFGSCKREAYESPAYRIEKTQGDFEIRRYPESTLATTSMKQRGADGSFMRLFRFISGRNEQSEKISMTVPVLMSGVESGTMSFVVPKKIALKGVPRPADPSVRITTMPEGDYATYRFSGRAGTLQNEAAAKKLSLWISERHLVTEGAPMFASYNPPWTPGFMRRNEVLIRINGCNPAIP